MWKVTEKKKVIKIWNTRMFDDEEVMVEEEE